MADGRPPDPEPEPEPEAPTEKPVPYITECNIPTGWNVRDFECQRVLDREGRNGLLVGCAKTRSFRIGTCWRQYLFDLPAWCWLKDDLNSDKSISNRFHVGHRFPDRFSREIHVTCTSNQDCVDAGAGFIDCPNGWNAFQGRR